MKFWGTTFFILLFVLNSENILMAASDDSSDDSGGLNVAAQAGLQTAFTVAQTLINAKCVVPDSTTMCNDKVSILLGIMQGAVGQIATMGIKGNAGQATAGLVSAGFCEVIRCDTTPLINQQCAGLPTATTCSPGADIVVTAVKSGACLKMPIFGLGFSSIIGLSSLTMPCCKGLGCKLEREALLTAYTDMTTAATARDTAIQAESDALALLHAAQSTWIACVTLYGCIGAYADVSAAFIAHNLTVTDLTTATTAFVTAEGIHKTALGKCNVCLATCQGCAVTDDGVISSSVSCGGENPVLPATVYNSCIAPYKAWAKAKQMKCRRMCEAMALLLRSWSTQKDNEPEIERTKKQIKDMGDNNDTPPDSGDNNNYTYSGDNNNNTPGTSSGGSSSDPGSSDAAGISLDKGAGASDVKGLQQGSGAGSGAGGAGAGGAGAETSDSAASGDNGLGGLDVGGTKKGAAGGAGGAGGGGAGYVGLLKKDKTKGAKDIADSKEDIFKLVSAEYDSMEQTNKLVSPKEIKKQGKVSASKNVKKKKGRR